MKDTLLAFIDTETTGLDPNRHEIIELGLIVCKQVAVTGRGPKLEILKEYEWKVKPTQIELAQEDALRINGYNETDWMFAYDLTAVMEEFAKATQSCTFVSHNLTFDYAFIMNAFKKSDVDSKMHYAKIDTISVAFARLYDTPQATAFSLRALCELFKIDNSKAHTALSDTRALVAIYKKLMNA